MRVSYIRVFNQTITRPSVGVLFYFVETESKTLKR